MVRDGIVKATASLNQNFVHRPDKYKGNNDGSYWLLKFTAIEFPIGSLQLKYRF